MNIRIETDQDRSRVATLIARTYGVDGARVIELAGRLRAEAAEDNGCALVAEDSGEVEAYALFTPLETGQLKNQAVLMAPFAVNPSNENFDGTEFVKGAMQKVAEKGFRYIFLLGLPQELSEDGFEPAQGLGMVLEDGIDAAHVLVKDFGEDKGAGIEGVIQLPDCLKS